MGKVCVWIGKLRCVSQVEELCTKMDCVGLVNRECTFDGEVDVSLRGATQESDTAVAKVCIEWTTAEGSNGSGRKRGTVDVSVIRQRALEERTRGERVMGWGRGSVFEVSVHETGGAI